MFTCILLKLLGSLIGLITINSNESNQMSAYLQAFCIGILPVWLEYIACRFINIEPAREARFRWRLTDTVVDAFCFIILPATWFYFFSINSTIITKLTLLLFIVAGIYRLINFLKTGLIKGQFIGLPVTYTGYFWIIAVFLINHGWPKIAVTSLIMLSIAMVTNKIKIKPSLSS